MAKFAKIIQKNNENLLIEKFIRLLNTKIQNNGKKRFSFVLTGGNSPIKLYKKLAKNKYIKWKNVDFFIGDERFVKETSKNSNINLVAIETHSPNGDTLDDFNNISKYFEITNILFTKK